MARKRLTEAEKARTPLQEELAKQLSTRREIDSLVDDVERWHKLSHQEAICALRDYFQWLLAAEADKSLEETRQRITELESKLAI